MTGPPRDDAGDRVHRGGTRGESPPPAPLWVKVFGLIFLLVALVFLVLLFVRGPMGGNHGPGRHLSVDADAPAPSYVTTMPVGGPT